MGLLFQSLTYDLLLLAISLAIYLYSIIRARMRYFEGSGIPYIPSSSPLENNPVGAFSDVSVGEVYDRMYKKMSGYRYGGFFNILKPSIMLRDPALIHKLLTKEHQFFNDHGLPTDEETNPMEENLFFLSGLKWRILRRKLSPTFTSGKLKWMYGVMRDCADEMVEHVEKNTGIDLEMRDLIARFTTDVIGSCAFGLEPESMKNPNSKFRQMGKKFFEPDLITLLRSSLRFMIPSIFKKLKIKDQPQFMTDFFQSLTSQTIQHRIQTGEERKDFVQLLLQLKMKGYVVTDPQDVNELEPEEMGDEDIVIEFTDSLLAAQSSIFFIAGFETTASAISYTIYLLGKHQDAQERARQDIKKSKAKHGGVINYEVVKNVPYLEACLLESMRLYPPIHLLPRQCTKDYRMEDGYVIKQGTPVFVPIYSIHRDPEYYPDPEEFKPDRFMGNGEESRLPGTYLPFGYGPRLCIARRFAMLESVLILAKILDNFQFTLSSRMADTLKLVSKSFIVVPEGGMWLSFKKIDE